MELTVILSALTASLAWGAGDFAGGLASRCRAAARIVLASQAIGTAALLLFGLWLREPLPAPAVLLAGAIGGLGGGMGVLLFYMSMAQCKMGIAAPLTAVASGGIPLFVGLLTEGLPGAGQLAGFLLALPALWLISRPDGSTPVRREDIVLPLLAGVGFGVFLTIIGRIEPGQGFVWPLVAVRATSMTMMLVVSFAGRRTAAGQATGRFPWGLATVAGLGDTAGNVFFMLASQTGRLDVAAVLGSLYPAVTTLLAWLLLGERLSPRQNVGVGMAMMAVMLIAL
ncbi:MAG: DMT family transporter [Anaerolineae bacterium]|uniref:EamA family transporter n=1 Tax=Promineifilum sp. TaxID=2664178 RepID=UPI001DD3DBE0|nr:DMT family transporter [Anaerolineales bacterium]MCB8936067.1 DMT family transporter [Promineifilum sp.]MCO5181687.1 DMT family transporter [Promineifilum sp.]MCW5847794.1 DMT family transporter [Anaerolineae bacterium]